MTIYTFINKIINKIEQKRRGKYIDGLIHKGLKLGNNVEIIDTFFFDPSHCFLISIGDNCTICPNVRLIAHDASTKKHLGYTKIGRIDIKENCFIGDSVIVLPNVTVRPNSIVVAGSFVSRDIPAFKFAAGNSATFMATLVEYIKRIESISRNKRIFDEQYYIERLDKAKREEIIKSIDDSIGFYCLIAPEVSLIQNQQCLS